ncbi:MAG: hypothetical protein V7717_12325 [Porticoccaceae bacterium]
MKTSITRAYPGQTIQAKTTSDQQNNAMPASAGLTEPTNALSQQA